MLAPSAPQHFEKAKARSVGLEENKIPCLTYKQGILFALLFLRQSVGLLGFAKIQISGYYFDVGPIVSMVKHSSPKGKFQVRVLVGPPILHLFIYGIY
jgi:hypothetical protein